MKKILALILVALLALGMTACGTKQTSEVAVLWADGDTAVVPNSLINAMDRALYIQHLAPKYYGAEGDAAKQAAQAQEALNAGAKVLLVEAVDNDAVLTILDAAKAKGAYVVFFGCEVDETLLSSYEKGCLVATDKDRLAYAVNSMVEAFLKDNDKADRNGDGNLTYGVVGELAVHITGAAEVSFDPSNLNPATAPDFVITENDEMAFALLQALQLQDYNTDKLVTQSIPVFTVGNTVDYRALVLEGAPTGEEARKAHYEANKYLCDLTTVKEENLAEMIFTTLNVIDTGRINGTAIEDFDAIAEATAALAASLVKNQAPDAQVVKIPYTTYTN